MRPLPTFGSVLWLACLACREPSAPAPHGSTPTGASSGDVVYDNVGVACLRTRPDASSEVLVDFGDCLFGSEDLSCSATIDGDRVEVDAGGTVHLDETARVATCQATTASCDAGSLGAAAWTLSYAGVDVDLVTPADNWVCTGPTAVL